MKYFFRQISFSIPMVLAIMIASEYSDWRWRGVAIGSLVAIAAFVVASDKK